MKKNRILSLIASLFLLAGCQRDNSVVLIPTSKMAKDYLTSGFIGKYSGDVRVITEDSSGLFYVSPFGTSISGTLYSKKGTYAKDDINVIQEDFDHLIRYYSALSDRHYDYRLVTERDSTGKAKTFAPIHNLKTINDSYGSGRWIDVDPFLYDTLKKNIEFSLLTEGRFNVFIGELSELYDNKISEVKKGLQNCSPLDAALTVANNAYFSSDIDAGKIQAALQSIPQTKEEMASMLEFKKIKDAQGKILHEIKFNCSPRGKGKVSMTLGGSAKGFATDAIASYFQRIYPDISLLINSGASSIKTVGKKPDGSSFAITYVNPIYRESIKLNEKVNPYETFLKLDGPFSLSTSGYYENYFYVFQGAGKKYLRRDHIIDVRTGYSQSFFDQVSVILDDAGTADMFTTALMNASSLEEAKNDFSRWTKALSLKEGKLILCYKGQPEKLRSLYAYGNDGLTNLSSYGLPKVVLVNGTVYDGNYQNGISSLQIDGSKTISSRVSDFREVFAYSKNLSGKIDLFTKYESTFFPHPDKAISSLLKL